MLFLNTHHVLSYTKSSRTVFINLKMESSDVCLLTINAVVYLFTFFCFLKKRGYDIVSFVFLLYTLLSVSSLLLYIHPLTETMYTGLNLWGFVFLYFGLLCFMLPIRKIHKSDMIIPPRKDVFHIVIIVIFLLSLSRLPSAILHLQSGFSDMLFDPTGFNDAYQERMQSFVGGGGSDKSLSLLSIAYGVVGDTAIFLYIYYQTVCYRKGIFSYALLLSSLIILVSYISDAERGGIARVILIFYFSYVLFKERLAPQIKKKVNITMWSIFILLVMILGAITASRFTNKSYYSDDFWSYSILLYIGQPILEFDKYVVSESETRHGERTAALVKTIVEPQGGPYDYSHRISRYSRMSIDESSFSTFLGDLSLDYGMVITGGICFFVALSAPFFISRHRNRPFKKYILIYILLNIVICGWHLFPFSDVGGNLKFLFNIFLYLFL